jgi:hypothetical protein
MSFQKPNYAQLAPWAKEHAKQHWSFCKQKTCHWHNKERGDQFDEREYEEPKSDIISGQLHLIHDKNFHTHK